jgi:hypothetical protein
MSPGQLIPFSTPPKDVAALVAQREEAEAAEEARDSAKTIHSTASVWGGLAGFALIGGGAVAILAKLLEWVGQFASGNIFSHIITQSFAQTSSAVLFRLAAVLGVGFFPLIAFALHQWLRAGRLQAVEYDPDSVDGGQPLISCHRRYVVPNRDLDQESLRLWERTVDAVAEIPTANTFATGRVDSAVYTAELPYRLWDIALDLASLTNARADNARIIGAPDQDRPAASPSLGQRRHIEGRAVQRVLVRIGKLEDFAAKLREADDAIRLLEAVEHLWTPSEHHIDLLARQLAEDDALGPDGRLTQEADAARRQAEEAIRKANEAGSALCRSEDDQADLN